MNAHARRLLDPIAPAGGGSADPPVTAPPATAPPVAAPPVVDPVEGYKAALKRHDNDAHSLARDAYTRLTESDRQLAEVRGKLSAAGSVVLDKAAADELAAYRALGKPADVVAKLGTLDGLNQSVAANARERLIHTAATTQGTAGPLGYDADVLASLLPAAVPIELRDGKDRFGKDAKFADVLVTTKDERGEKVEKVPLETYMSKHFAKFLPSLKAATGPQPAAAPRGPLVPPTMPQGEDLAPTIRSAGLKFGRF